LVFRQGQVEHEDGGFDSHERWVLRNWYISMIDV
jgi:hypothetical protein